MLGALVAATAGDERIKDISDAMERANARLQQVTMFLAQRGMQNPAEAAADATDYQRLFGTVVLGHMWLWMAQVASAKLASGSGDDAAFYETKLRTARFYATRVLPQATALGHMIQSGGAAINEFEPEMF